LENIVVEIVKDYSKIPPELSQESEVATNQQTDIGTGSLL